MIEQKNETRAFSRLLKGRNFRIYFAGRAVSVLGDGFYTIALILAVLQSTHSVTSGAMVMLAGTVPVIILALLAGALGDRIPRHRIMFSSDLVRAGAQIVMALILMRTTPPLWALMLTQFVYGVGDAFFEPAATGLLPQMVAVEDLPAANSLLQLTSNSALVVGPAIAGVVISLVGASVAVAIDALSFLLSAISLYFLHVPTAGFTLGHTSIISELRDGWVEMRKRSWLLVTACYLVLLAFAFTGPVLILGPAISLSRLGGTSAWSLIFSVFSLGLISGSLIAPAILRRRGALGWAYLANFGTVPMLILLGTSHSKSLVAAVSVLAGLSVSIFSVTYSTLIQQSVSNDVISRVSSFFWLARVAATPLAFAVIGPLASYVGAARLLVLAALVICFATLAGAGFPSVWSINSTRNETSPHT